MIPARTHRIQQVVRIPIAVVLVAIASAEAIAQQPPASSETLRNANGANAAFDAVGRLQATLTCTGSLIDPSGAGLSSAQAWLLTAGHCTSLEPYGVILSQPSTARVQFNYFVDTPSSVVTIQARRTGWSTMKGVDIGLIELDATIGDLVVKGIRPLRLATASPQSGQPVFWTGISESPIPPEMQFLRLGHCTLGRRVPLIEGSWIWKNDLSNDCPDLYPGASGSPLFDAASNEIIGVIGTSTILNFEHGPDYDCQVNRPCILTESGPAVELNTSYASPVEGLSQCFDQMNVLDLQRPGCALDPGFQLTIQSGANEVRPIVDGKPATWDATLSGTQRYYSYKHFPAGNGDCASPTGYSQPTLVTSAPMIHDLIGTRDGYYFLCVIAGDTPSVDSHWQQLSNASVRFKRIDSQPPVVQVDYEIEPLNNAYQLVNQTGGDGPSGLGAGLQKRGPPWSTDCSDPKGYGLQISIPPVIRTSDFPTRICWKLSDKAGNFAAPAQFDFGPPVILPNAMRNGASLVRGTVAAGSVFRVDTFNLTDVSEFSAIPVATLGGVRVSVQDGAGRTLPVLMTTAGPLFLEALMPDSATPGEGTLVVQPSGSSTLFQAVRIASSAPGLYFDTGTGAVGGYAIDSKGNVFPLSTCVVQQGCFTTHLPVASTPGGMDLIMYGTGLRSASGRARMHIGTYTINSVDISPHAGYAGVDDLRFHLAQDFPLHLYQSVSAETPEGESNYLWIYLD
jgi:uncharacterized protein (TIGR03437 family)